MTDHDAAAREILADVEHTRWANWQRWMHRCGHRNADGSLLIPANLVERWDRQIGTAYADLSKPEKDSDRKEADTSIDALTAAGYRIVRATPDAGGAVEISVADANRICRAVARSTLPDAPRILAVIEAAIAAGKGGRDDDGE